jgi:hypothetical protein
VHEPGDWTQGKYKKQIFICLPEAFLPNLQKAFVALIFEYFSPSSVTSFFRMIA